MNLAKTLSIILAVVLVANFVLFVLRKVTLATFWLVIILSAIIAYIILPKIAKKNKAPGGIRTPE